MAKTKYFTLIYYAEFLQYGGWAVMAYGLAHKFGNLKMWAPLPASLDSWAYNGWYNLAFFLITGLHMIIIGQLISNFIDIEVNTRSRRERYQRDDPY
jgi:hypothetical protein